jgi:hypothetical protein
LTGAAEDLNDLLAREGGQHAARAGPFMGFGGVEGDLAREAIEIHPDPPLRLPCRSSRMVTVVSSVWR